MFDCQDCTFRGVSSETLKDHLTENHIFGELFSFILDETDKVKKDIISLEFEKVPNNEIVQREKMINNFSSVNESDQDEGIKGEITKMQFLCDKNHCSFATRWKASLDRHTESIHQDQNILRFYCNVCDFKSYSYSSVRKHQVKHDLSKERRVLKVGCLKCEQNVDHKSHHTATAEKYCKEQGCNFSTGSLKYKSILKCHHERVHLKILRYFCNLCGLKNYYKRSIRRHQKSDHKDEKVQKVLKIGNEVCKQKTEGKPDSIKYQCDGDGCNYTNYDKFRLQSHYESQHLQILKFVCNLCEYKSYFSNHVRYHQISMHIDNKTRKVLRIGCEFCEQNIEHAMHSRESIRQSKIDVQSRRETQATWDKKSKKPEFETYAFHCKVDNCLYGTKYKRSLDRHHDQIHLRMFKFACNLCEHQAYESATIRIHQVSKHSNNESRKVLRIGCTFCAEDIPHQKHSNIIPRTGQKSKKSSEIGGKRRRNKNVKLPDKCDECEHKDLSNLQDRFKHYKAEHPGKNIFNCSQCKYGSNYLPNLKSHVNSRHEKKKLQCQICPYKTTWNQTFLSHMRSEHGFFKNNTKYNVRGDGDGQSYLCQGCGYSTFSQADFKRHEKLPACPPHKYKRSITTEYFKNYSSDMTGSIKKYKCNKCDYNTDYPGHVRDHYRAVH